MIRLEEDKLGNQKPDLTMQVLLFAYQSKVCLFQIDDFGSVYDGKPLPQLSCRICQRVLLSVPLLLFAVNAKGGPAFAVSHSHCEEIIV